MEDFLYLLVILGLILLIYTNLVENYSQGTTLQLMQSSPYYTPYDFQLHEKRLLNLRPSYPYPMYRMNPVMFNRPEVYL